MKNIFIELANILRLRGGPQNLPSSWSLTTLLLIAYMVQNLVIGQQFEDDNASAKSLLSITLQVIVLVGLLSWRRHLERFAQTLSALTGVGIVVTAIVWALLTLASPETNQPMLAVVYWSVVAWSLFVDAHIYRNSLSVALSVGLLIALLTLTGSYVLIEMLFLV